MEPTNAELLAAIEALHARHAEAADRHALHHEWISAQIAREQARAAFWANLADKSVPYVFGALVVAMLTGMWHIVAGRFGLG